MINIVTLSVGTPELLGSALSADNEFTVEILGVNSNPVLLLVDDTTQITLYREYNDSVVSIGILVAAYDVDGFDEVYFRYVTAYLNLFRYYHLSGTLV